MINRRSMLKLIGATTALTSVGALAAKLDAAPRVDGPEMPSSKRLGQIRFCGNAIGPGDIVTWRGRTYRVQTWPDIESTVTAAEVNTADYDWVVSA